MRHAPRHCGPARGRGGRSGIGRIRSKQEYLQQQFAQQLAVRGASGIQPLAFGVVFAQQAEDGENLAVVPQRSLLLDLPEDEGVALAQDAHELLIRREGLALVAGQPPQVVDHEQVAELSEQRHDRQQQRVVLWVAGEVVGNHQGPVHVLRYDGLAQLEVVEVLRDADMCLDVRIGDAARAFGQRDGEFAQFVGDLRDVGSEVELAEDGVPVAFNTDALVFPIDLLAASAKIAVIGGLPWQQALEAMTIRAAEAAGVDELVGSITAGKHADLLVFSRDPIDLLVKPDAVFVDGICTI